MDDTRLGTGYQSQHAALDDITYLEKESRYADPDGQALGQERGTQQEESPW
jgi:hypothetical protein